MGSFYALCNHEHVNVCKKHPLWSDTCYYRLLSRLGIDCAYEDFFHWIYINTSKLHTIHLTILNPPSSLWSYNLQACMHYRVLFLSFLLTLSFLSASSAVCCRRGASHSDISCWRICREECEDMSVMCTTNNTEYDKRNDGNVDRLQALVIL